MDDLAAAREAVRRRDWVAARRRFEVAARAAPLDADDLRSYGDCCWWLGDLERALPLLQDAFRALVAADRVGTAALVALDVGYSLLLRGDEAQGSGWLSRAAGLLEDRPDAIEHAYLRHVAFEEAFAGGDLDAAVAAADAVHDAGRHAGDPTLVALGVLGRGRVLVARGEVARGMRLLDEAMVAAVSDELDPAWAGNIYCHLMVACHELADLRRAGEWTEATARWCERMPGAGPFMGICRVHRAQVLTARGSWAVAEQEVARVCDELASFDVEVVAEAHYQLGELHRLRGDLAGAEEELRAAHALGRDPQPALAALRLAQGRAADAVASLRTALAAVDGVPLRRAKLLPTAVEAALVSGDLELARAGVEELVATAQRYGTAGLAGTAGHAQAVVALADGDAEIAAAAARTAVRIWQELGVPHEQARARAVLADACQALGDRDAAALERAAAAEALASLGDRRARGGGVEDADAVLTPREGEVLRLVASGRTNKQIADQLVLSIRTVERHLATVYDKLGVHGRSARALAVSHAFRAGLLPPDAVPVAGTGGLRHAGHRAAPGSDLGGDLRATTQVTTSRRP